MDLDSAAKILAYFYRLVGTQASDPYLIANGEAQNDVAYLCLTLGCREAQRWLLDMGYAGWRKRSAALTFSGSDDTVGGRYVALPTDFLRAYGSRRVSALTEANGDRWGQEVDPEEMQKKGNFYYIQGEQLWLGRTALVPGPALYLDYHYQHPEWNASVTIDFNLQARSLIAAYAASIGMSENWLPGGPELELKIAQALQKAQQRARGVVRATKSPRQFRKATRLANHW